MLLSRTAITMHQPPLFMANLLPEPYQGRIRTVLAPYHLQPEVPLDGEDTEMVRGKYGSGTVRLPCRYSCAKREMMSVPMVINYAKRGK